MIIIQSLILTYVNIITELNNYMTEKTHDKKTETQIYK